MRQKELFYISITFFLTIVAWVLFDIFRNKQNITIEDRISQVESINFTLDETILRTLDEKKP